MATQAEMWRARVLADNEGMIAGLVRAMPAAIAAVHGHQGHNPALRKALTLGGTGYADLATQPPHVPLDEEGRPSFSTIARQVPEDAPAPRPPVTQQFVSPNTPNAVSGDPLATRRFGVINPRRSGTA